MKESSYFIDTNIFLRALVHDLPKQSIECVKLLSKMSSGNFRLVTSSLVMAEFAWTLKSYYRLDKEQIIEALQALRGIRNLKVHDQQNVGLGNELYATHPVKYIDALIASTPALQSGDMRIISYDKDFDRLRVKRVEPSALL